MSFDVIIQSAQALNPLFFLKLGVLIVIGLFAIFTFIIFNQIVVMNNIVNQSGPSTILKIIAAINILLSLSLFLTALVIL